jgi:hypothetical protein
MGLMAFEVAITRNGSDSFLFCSFSYGKVYRDYWFLFSDSSTAVIV